ncbi:cobalt-precorrin-5B (C(1))-methyltransferase [Hoeflea prorocentri]|uniref:Cobalt-precorrin-5B C(1)-methyltransferase n=1 Tax=Hoeflea prorocentri TaxID=1922333 RepID=A0A9X3ZI05_9HYPH|nr:cobalt-precorrin-5B (C(1))-methyltransferase [Hoeflea prorocentri]MCY6381376.1 cobalt-precorrin-5B (C(1))-methyltransferase [Hoeflea prorocentri]MDA5399176.1 cobalt-precorrin-5B (C(1))-methyltransferase [Hoeflea prorocentri]
MTATPTETKSEPSPLRRGWTTGACATAATKAALTALFSGTFPDPVTIRLPKGQEPSFALAFESSADGYASAGIVKDAGDDPDVTHGATVVSTVRKLPDGAGIRFTAGSGVGRVTLPGLPLAVGEPAINPVPREMMQNVVDDVCAGFGQSADIEITISIPGGEELAEKTWNPRLGIVGGLSVLGTTGIVQPFSCSAWIHSIHRGIDVARAAGLTHVMSTTGSTSEATARKIYDLPDIALLDMGDFAGGLLKYLRRHPVDRLTIAGGFAKLTKLAQGALDLHSGRSQVDMEFLAGLLPQSHRGINVEDRILSANTALEVLEIAKQNKFDIAGPVACKACETAVEALRGAPVSVDIIVTDRKGNVLARYP